MKTRLGVLLSLALFAGSSLAWGQSTVPISGLSPATTPLADTEVAPIVQAGATKKATIASIKVAFKGIIAPTSPIAGQFWFDTTTTAYALKQYDGTQWVAIGTLDTVAHTWTPVGGGGGGLTIGSTTITSGTNGRLEYNNSGILGEITLTSLLDTISSTQGTVIYRGASSWSALAPGTSGQFLQTGGAAANPSWASAAGGGTVTSITCGAGLNCSGSNPITSSGTITPTVTTNAQTGTSYTFVTTDCGKLVSTSNASAIASSLPAASTTGFTAGCGIDIDDIGAGTNTITTTTSIFDNGLATLGVAKGQYANVWSDSTNWHSALSLPLVSNNQLLANVSGATNYPTNTSLSTLLDNVTGNAQGTIIYRNASSWVALAPGTAGQLLQTGGASANPSWVTASGTGTVTTLTAGTGVTFSSGATCTTTCTINASGGSGAITLVSTQTASNSASLAWTGLTGTNYRLVCQNILPATNAAIAYLQFGTGGTPTWATSTYRWSGTGTVPSGTTTANGNTSDSGIALVSFGLSNAAPATNFRAQLFNLSGTIEHMVITDGYGQTGGGGISSSQGGGDYNGATTAVTAIRVIMSAGNITSGSCSLYSEQT